MHKNSQIPLTQYSARKISDWFLAIISEKFTNFVFNIKVLQYVSKANKM